ncbi:MAG: amidohydrolase family protein [Flavobacteriales bacterium]|nr:amidohydrolase family protein [Flavobacteriales bacterium]MCC6936857.1 amidohydrolase family protein [Flavobacteriales bacterium]
MARITNIHSHVFTGGCAPDYFFKMVLPSWADRWADEIKFFLEKPWMRRIIKAMASRRGHSQLLRYLQFIEVGTQSTQEEVFVSMRNAYAVFGPEVRFVALTLNMDHMDVQASNHARIETQLAEVERVRTHYPDVFFPFVGVDPRHLSGVALRDWVKEKVERRMFFGIKIYPSIGFFPFDAGLDELYKWAEAEQVPVMTHCTRSGTFYTGAMDQVLADPRPSGLNPMAPEMVDIHARITAFKNNPFSWKDSKYGCNIFLHPQNYEPVLRKYPKLKLCFAHFGGDDEMLNEKQPLRDKGIDPTNWHNEVKRIMSTTNAQGDLLYPNTYTDISYTLFRDKIYPLLLPLIDGPLGDRILFGTDFFMTLREDPEAALLKRCIDGMTMERFRRIAMNNNDNFLRSSRYDPASPIA